MFNLHIRVASTYLQPIIISIFIMTLVGCGAKHAREVEESGFLGDYSKLVKQEAGAKGPIYEYYNPDADCKQYHKVMIEPVVLLSASADSDFSKLEAPDKAMLQTLAWGTLHDGFTRANFEIVNTPGPDVLKVRAAITDAEKANVAAAETLAVAPYVWVGGALWSMGTGKWPFLGELSGEMEILDSQKGKRLYAAVDKVTGALYNNLDPTARWDDVRAGFDRWREGLGMRMRACHQLGTFAPPQDDRSFVKKTYEYLAP